MKKFLAFHTTDKFSMLDGFVISIAGAMTGQGMYGRAFLFTVVGIFTSAVITVLVERMR